MGNTLLVRGGRLIDKARGYHAVNKDILIEDGIITRIDDVIDDVPADVNVLQLSGEYVAPGFIDAHAHVYTGVSLGVPADEIGIRTGTTTIIDAGSAGPENMADFIERDIKSSKTRVFSAMHYARTGLLDPPEADDESKYDLDLAREAYDRYKDYIVAIKARASNSCVGQLGIKSVEVGKELAKSLGLPIVVHIGNMPPTVEEVLNLMEEGDIITHAFHGKKNNLFTDGHIKPEAQAARDRGVLFDLGHGKDSFNFNVGKLAKSLGFEPDMMSTDLHALNYKGPVYSQSVTLDKMLALGYDLEDCIDRVTERAAKYLKLDGLGCLACEAYGDLTIFNIEEGQYQFTDSNGNELEGHRSIDVRYTVVGGEVVMTAEAGDVSDADEQLLERLKKELNLTDEAYPRYRQHIIAVLNLLKNRNIIFEEDNKLAFVSHVITLFTRLETGEKVADLGDEVLDQLLPEAVEITREMMDWIAGIYGPADASELALVAIHIHTAMEIMQDQ